MRPPHRDQWSGPWLVRGTRARQWGLNSVSPAVMTRLSTTAAPRRVTRDGPILALPSPGKQLRSGKPQPGLQTLARPNLAPVIGPRPRTPQGCDTDPTLEYYYPPYDADALALSQCRVGKTLRAAWQSIVTCWPRRPRRLRAMGCQLESGRSSQTR